MDLKIETVKIADLTPDPDNARLHDEQNLDAITASLRRFGQVKPIVITSSGKVLAGNGTLTAATRLGWIQVQAVRTPADWSDTEAMAYALADNRTAELADWNQQILASTLTDLEANGWDLNDLGFSAIPVRNLSEATEPSNKNRQDHDPIRCPKCGFTWIPTAKVAAE